MQSSQGSTRCAERVLLQKTQKRTKAQKKKKKAADAHKTA